MVNSKNIEYFISGAISPTKIAEIIAQQQKLFTAGGHDIFLGQIRADNVNENIVQAIEYTAYEAMAIEGFEQIKSEISTKYKLNDLSILHSLGIINKGEICLFVMASSAHRKEAIEGCKECVERIKKELPIWGKEIFENEDYQWKTNH
jgi:molybdopterin synthase catalytic subunit